MITTRIDDQCFDADAAGRLSEIFTKNVVDCPTFEEWFRTSFDDCPADHSALLGATHHLRSQVRAVALAKWLIALGVSKRVAVSSAGCVCYSVRKTNGFPDLVSMAFVVGVAEHDAATDPHGLAQPAKIPLTFDECELAIEALISMADSTDADSALRDNEDLRSELIAETAALLGSAGHDPSAYMLWANQGETA
jgi:hypothetical protein